MTDDVPMNLAEFFRDVTDAARSGTWAWTRQTEIVHIRYKGDHTGFNAPWRRVARAFMHAFGPRPAWEKEIFPRQSWKDWLWGVYGSFVTNIPPERHLPDGDLNEGKIICHWEEDGEYLQMVQPSVGALLAEFLLAEPDNEHARKILAEMQRIEDDYSQRIADLSEEEE